MSLLPPGSRLGRFEIAGVLGQGAMGVVYLAHDPEIERRVAVKTVRPETAGGESGAELESRFLKEAKLAGRLQHPNIVTVYDVGRDRGVCFIAMEYVDGRPLTDWLGKGATLSLAAKVGVVRQVALALAHAHERDVLHRDIKPGNILIGKDGRVKVTDFGIGRLASASTSDLTRSGHMIGSPAYMSPEQVRGEKLDGRADLFSLGVVLYELLTGCRPFPGDSITTLVYQILHTEPRDPLELNAGLPPSTREVMARLLAKRPERRPVDAGEFQRELGRIERIQRDSEITRLADAETTRRAVAPPAVRSEVAPPTVRSKVAPPTAPIDSTPPATPAATPPAAPRRRSSLTAILAVAATVLAALLLLREWSRRHEAAPAPAVAPAAPTPAAAVEPMSRPATTPVVLPTPGPREAADAIVGAPRIAAGAPQADRPRRERTAAVQKTDLEPAGSTEAGMTTRGDAGVGSESAASPSSAPQERSDAVYATRQTVRFTSSPDQMRLYVDGRYVGIADDWDNRGGGREFAFDRPGRHVARMELPGYRSKQIEIDVSPNAEKDSVSIDEELDRREKVPYEKLGGIADRTTGPVVFQVDPPGAVVGEGDRILGPADSFGAASPLELRGPQVHDLTLSAPGFQTRRIRILVAPNAGRDRATVKLELKREKR